MSEPREYTAEEARQMLIKHISHVVDYWAEQDGSPEWICQGVAFSILTMLDGCAGMLPGFLIAPSPHEDDREYNIEHGENWWPENHDAVLNGELGGSLHDEFMTYRGERGGGGWDENDTDAGT